MAIVSIVNEIKKPIIVLSGDWGVGKSYINKIIKKYIQSAISINKYDFITRKLLFILGIHPLQVGYTLLYSDVIDRQLYTTNNKLLYLRNNIQQNSIVKSGDVEYLFKNVFNIIINKDQIDKCVQDLNHILMSTNKGLLKSFLYSFTTYVYDDILYKSKIVSDQDFISSYLDDMMKEFEIIFNEFKYRIVYYAYTPEEMKFFQDKYDSHSIFIDMAHKLQSQLLIKNGLYDKADESVKSYRLAEIDKMRKLSDFVISNDLEMDNRIINKIMSQLPI